MRLAGSQMKLDGENVLAAEARLLRPAIVKCRATTTHTPGLVFPDAKGLFRETGRRDIETGIVAAHQTHCRQGLRFTHKRRGFITCAGHCVSLQVYSSKTDV